ncbi:alpha/beta hydrolase family protein [Pelosinus baikalensis]|uniref:1-alkyl-2-acetylglycerophosphocholine esterase n=1 Tax=Pelosinus baikalensis TaxID=2892015 RepID=A0ABS8HTN2_9FIRM|nr:hypothetical protein [Pelosinus baikalensis]MCC5465971.1 hypothetical protein [Pelosinus baikalensis]
MKRLWLIVTVFLLTLGNTSVGLAQWAGVELPAVTGPYGVGTVVLPMVDSGRPGVYADGSSSEHREFMTQIWYPTDLGVDGPKSTYMDEASAEYMLKEINMPEIDKNIRFQIKTHGVVGAQVAAGRDRFPVVIFSPGWRTSYFLYQSILEDLASHGYVVVGVNSPNSAGIVAFPDGHVRVTPEIEDKSVKVQYNQDVADDLKFVAKQLWVLDSNSQLPLNGRIDFGRVGCFGHSFGGAAAVQASIQSIRLAAAANFDGSLRGEDYKKKISKPMMMIWSEVHPQGDLTMRTIWGNLPKGSYQAQVKGTNHMSFSDYMLVVKSIGLSEADDNPNSIDSTRALQISRDTVRSFFDVNLKHADSNQLNRIGREYQEVKLEEKRN